VLVSSYITPKARKGMASGIEGRGLAALAPIGAGEIVAIKGGHIVTSAVLQSLPERLQNSEIQIADGFHLVALEEAEYEPLRKPTAWRIERASAGVQTPCSPSSLTASPLSAGGPHPWVQPQDPAFVNHGLPSPGLGGGGELPVGASDPRQLVEVDLPGHRLPADPRDLVVLEQEPPADGHPPGQLKRRIVEDEQVHPGGKQHIE
jgi:hypothetical protein